jgi:uncharacterized protein YjfI (DUF2170 family)
MKNKNIMLEATVLIIGTILLISGPIVSSMTIPNNGYEFQSESQQNNKIFFGFGHIGLITIDGKDYLKGVINGNISIKNTGSQTWIPYFLVIKDKVNNITELKWSLPEEFILNNFSGIGKINYYDIPRGGPEWTAFFLMGTFEKIIID